MFLWNSTIYVFVGSVAGNTAYEPGDFLIKLAGTTEFTVGGAIAGHGIGGL